MKAQMNIRPMCVMNDWLEKYGFDKNRTTGDDRKTMGYTRTAEYIDGEWVSRWKLAGLGDSPVHVLAELFEDAMNTISNNINGEFTPQLETVLLVTHGVGRWSFANPETGEVCELEDLPEELQELARQREHESVGKGDLPCRIVNLITATGLAADVSTWVGDDVSIDQVEQWSEDGEGTVPQSNGIVDDALMGTFGFLMLLRESAERHGGVGFREVMATAEDLARDGDPKQLAFLLKMISDALNAGILETGDFFNGED